MPQTDPTPAVRTTNVYLLFAHEPYYPGPGSQEINTTVVAAGSLLHPQVLQPDGARIHVRRLGRHPLDLPTASSAGAPVHQWHYPPYALTQQS